MAFGDYFRFHGRNQNWFNASREERYNYLYSEEELQEFIPPLRSVSTDAKTRPTRSSTIATRAQ